MSYRGEEHVLVKDPLTLAYFQLPILQYRVLDALNGHRSLNEILSQVQVAGVSSAIGTADVFRLILDLASKRLIWSQRADTVDALLSQSDQEGWHRFWVAIRNPLFIRFPGLYPGQILSRAAACFGWIYSTPAALVVAAFVVFSWICCLLHADTFARELPVSPAFLSGNGIWTLWIVVGLLKVCHELSHGIACERFGAQCQSIGFAFLFFSPCMYCDVSDAWLLEKKRHRIAISLAGVYVELFLSALGFWCWRFSGPGLLHQISLQIFLAGSIATLMFNANPLLKFDGYYVLADLLEFPNLYPRSRKAMRRLAARYFLGIRTPDDELVSERQSQSILVSYGLASTAYQIPMLFGLWIFSLHFFESRGLAAIPFIYLFVKAIHFIHRTLTWGIHMSQGHSSVKPSRRNLTVTAISLVGIAIGIWFCPLGSTVTSPVIMELRSTNPVYVETPGTVRQVCVSEGDHVEQGTVLVELEDLSFDRRLVALEGLAASHEIDFRMAQSISDPDLMSLAKTANESVSDQLKHLRAEKERLQLRAGVSGIVISADETVPNPEQVTKEPKDASAGLLNSRLIGSYLSRRMCLCQISPSSQWQAMIWVDQRHRQYLSTGQPVSVRLEAFSGNDITGKIQTVGAANELEIPAVLSAKFGGPFNTKSTSTGEVPTEPVYRATILLEHVNTPVQPGMRGIGRFVRPAVNVGSWLLDELHRVFVVR